MKFLSPFAALSAVGLLARFSYALARSPVLPLFALYLGAGPESIGLIVGISTVTGIFFKLPFGALSDHIGRKKTMLLGLVVFALAPFMYLWVEDYHALYAIRFAHGMATAIFGPVAMAVVMDLAGQRRRAEMVSWYSSLTIIGTLLGAPVGGYILHGLAGAAEQTVERPDFLLAYLVSGISGVVALLLGLIVLMKGTEERTGGDLRGALRRLVSGAREVISDRGVFFTSNTEGVQNLAVGALEAFLPIYAVTVAGLSEWEAGLLWGVQVLAAAVSKPAMGKLSDRHGRKPLVTAGLVLCAVALGALPLATGFIALLAISLIFGLGEAFVTSSSAALVADLCKARHYGTAMGVFGTIFDVGHASGPILAGLLIARVGYAACFWIIAGVLLIWIPVFLLNVREPGASR